jgi:class 3 adenylate cyclase/tetratricopeptide (TPR) repeat protein
MCGAALAALAAVRERRKNVSMLFIDIVGSTSLAERLDPEALRQVIDRYFAGCTDAVTAHGGMVEKFIGDAVLAVFGADVSHEDDALRAVRAALDSLTALEALNDEISATHRERLAARCGICSGEVVVLVAESGDFRVIGDPVNTASRMQNAAGSGEVFIDAATADLVRAHATLAEVPPLTLKGKSHPVPAWRVTSATAPTAQAEPRELGPVIGRDDELDQLSQIYRRVTQRGQVCMVTVLGVPGIGKSRLVREFVSRISDGQALVLTGRCSAYGKGMTLRPLAEMSRSYPGGWEALSAFLRDTDPQGAEVAGYLAGVLDAGLNGSGQAQAGIQEISWAVRTMLDVTASAQPVVLVWEDLHWAEESLLNLIDDAAKWLTGVPVLQVCLARPDLLEAKPTWGGGKTCSVMLDLGPLTAEQSMELVRELTCRAEVTAHQQDDLAASVAVACDGNPLFAELMLDVCAESGPSAAIPATIQALLGARLDQIPDAERQVLERAAVIGRDFSGEPLLAMSRADGVADSDVRSCLTWLQRRRLIARAGQAGTFSFTQSLLRDTAYGFTPKARREHWHQVLARWLSDRSAASENGAAWDDALAMATHVEAAYTLGRELRPGDTRRPEQAGAAAGVLLTAGEEALARRDLPAAVNLLDRTLTLLPADDPRQLRTVLHLTDACLGMSDAARALAGLDRAQAALGPSDACAMDTCAIQRLIVDLRLHRQQPEAVSARAAELTGRLRDHDDLAWCRHYQLRAYLDLADDRAGDATTAFGNALGHARAAGDDYEEERILCAICELAQWSAISVADGLGLCGELAPRFAANRDLLLPVLLTRARLHAFAGDLAAAGDTLEIISGHARSLHMDLVQAAILEVSGMVASLGGAHEEALLRYREAEGLLRTQQRVHDAEDMQTLVARAQVELGLLPQARNELAALRDADLNLRTRVMYHAVRGRLAATAGDAATALPAAREAVRLSESSQDPYLQGEVWTDLAVVMRASGQPDWVGAARTALDRYQNKGADLPATRIRRWLSTPGQPAPVSGMLE